GTRRCGERRGRRFVIGFEARRRRRLALEAGELGAPPLGSCARLVGRQLTAEVSEDLGDGEREYVARGVERSALRHHLAQANEDPAHGPENTRALEAQVLAVA